MTSIPRLDALLGVEEPHATFHDARLLELTIYYESRVLTARFDMCVGDPDAPAEALRNRRRLGRVSLFGLKFWSLDPQAARCEQLETLWLTDDGPLGEAATEAGRSLAIEVRAGELGGYLYFANINCFAYYGAEQGEFAWL